ncbi:MAG: hypothetical protein M0P71_00620 [Melioribacteraceae bacterium]|nr:hypothetical protein [Melioribacteraceae bacterium]
MKKLYIILLVISFSVNAFAQGSVYSKFGLGEVRSNMFARSLGLGSQGIGFYDNDYLSVVNPASLFKIRLARFESGAQVNSYSIKDDNNSSFYSGTKFSGMQLAFPVEKDLGIVISAGLVPYTDINFEISTIDNTPIIDPHTIDFKGNGGLSRLFIASSYKLPFDFIIGASFDYFVGRSEYSTEIKFDTKSTFHDASFRKDYSYEGIGGTFGLLTSDLSHIFGTDVISDFRIGAVFGTGSSLRTDTVSNTDSQLGLMAGAEGVTYTELPIKYGLGFSFKIYKDYSILFDYMQENWSDYKYNDRNVSELKNSSSFSTGFEYKNAAPSAGSFWEQAMYRGGLSYETTNLELNGEAIDQFSLFAGASLPLGLDSYIDLGLQYGMRGTTNNKLLSENFLRFSVSLTLGELWFLRQDR